MELLKYNPTIHQYDSIGSTLDHDLGYEMCVNTITEKNNMTEVIDIRPIHLYFGRDLVNFKFSPEIEIKLKELNAKIIPCTCWSDLPEYLKFKPKSICFCYKELEYTTVYDIVNMVKTLCKLVNLEYELPICMSISNLTNISDVKLAQKSGVQGIIPRSDDFSYIEAAKGLDAVANNIPYWPKHIIDQLPGAKKKETKYNPGEIKLTPRQSQILHLIKDRGASNKVIAKHLNITESTVKLHVSIVLKKFNVKNRTQLALFSA